MPALLATDPGAWHIMLWTVILCVAAALVLYVATTLILRTRGKAGDNDPS
jgi:hypothetical protein